MTIQCGNFRPITPLSCSYKSFQFQILKFHSTASQCSHRILKWTKELKKQKQKQLNIYTVIKRFDTLVTIYPHIWIGCCVLGLSVTKRMNFWSASDVRVPPKLYPLCRETALGNITLIVVRVCYRDHPVVIRVITFFSALAQPGRPLILSCDAHADTPIWRRGLRFAQ